MQWIIPALLVMIAALGVWLIVTGGDDDATSQDASNGSGVTLPSFDTDSDAVSEVAGLDLPGSTTEFLTARLDDGSQLDITLTIDPSEESAFITGSGLPTPVESERFITHSSPLWELNPETPIRGTEDTYEDLTRRVELHDEDGRIRVRAVITPST